MYRLRGLYHMADDRIGFPGLEYARKGDEASRDLDDWRAENAIDLELYVNAILAKYPMYISCRNHADVPSQCMYIVMPHPHFLTDRVCVCMLFLFETTLHVG